MPGVKARRCAGGVPIANAAGAALPTRRVSPSRTGRFRRPLSMTRRRSDTRHERDAFDGRAGHASAAGPPHGTSETQRPVAVSRQSMTRIPRDEDKPACAVVTVLFTRSGPLRAPRPRLRVRGRPCRPCAAERAPRRKACTGRAWSSGMYNSIIASYGGSARRGVDSQPVASSQWLPAPPKLERWRERCEGKEHAGQVLGDTRVYSRTRTRHHALRWQYFLCRSAAR